jgi:programmed cell death protein 4
MVKGFRRVLDTLDDLTLDIPDAKGKAALYVEQAKQEGWLKPSFDENEMSKFTVPNDTKKGK